VTDIPDPVVLVAAVELEEEKSRVARLNACMSLGGRRYRCRGAGEYERLLVRRSVGS